MKIATSVLIFGMFLASTGIPMAAQAQEMAGMKMKPSTLSAQQKIALALSAGPTNVAKDATVVEPDGRGGMRVLRQGTNDFTCMPGDPSRVGMPPMCMDKVAVQWNKDFDEHKPRPTTTVPGIEYMLAGATQRSDTDPNDKTSPAIKIGPHWMILWPFDPKTTGLPTSHKPTGVYIMWAGSPYAHIHVMGRP
ncbi:hypothetical protein [Silvibacterium acidisoli]|uniref:hypothetical protein n=1 Tax=Acidobacteriaceae bacterium ZG23-2 TaxID=2883246 RepID=UPI00406C99C2